MAKYRITGPDGAAYEITAPDDADEGSILEYAKTQFGAKQDRFAGWTDDMRKRYESRKGASSPVSDRMTDSVLLGAKDEILAGLNTAAQAPFAFFTGDHDVSGRYDRNLKIERALRDDARAATPGAFGVSLDVIGGMALGAPRAAVAAAQAAQQAGSLLRNYLTATPQLAKTGAAWGGGQAFFDKDPSAGASTMDGFVERMQDVPGGATAGAVGALALGGGIMGGLNARDWIRARRGARANQNALVADEMRSVGISDPFGPAVTDSGTAQRTAAGLSGSIVGAPIRRAAGQNIDEFERAAQQALRRPTDGMAAADLGAETQRRLQDSLTKYSVPDDVIRAMPDGALERYTGPVTGEGFRPPRPVVEPVNPGSVPPQDYKRFMNESFEPAKFEPAYPSPNNVVPKTKEYNDIVLEIEKIRGSYDEATKFNASIAKEWAEAERTLDRMKSSGGRDFLYAMDKNYKQAYDFIVSNQDKVNASNATIINGNRLARVRDAMRNDAWHQEMRAAHEREVSRVGAENILRQEAAARRAADAETARLQETGRIEAESQTAARQRAADQEYERTVKSRPGFEPGRSRESYPTEFSAAYERVARETPAVQRNPLGGSPSDPQKTSTLDVLGQFADEARRGGLLPGSKRGEVFALQDKLLHPQFRSYLENRVGKDITQRIDYFVERRALGQMVPATQGLKDIRTAIGREISDLKRARKMGESRSQDEAMLSRLYDALGRDMHSFLQSTPQGQRASGMMKSVDDAYRSYMEDLRKPLAKIYGEKVAPIEAMDRLSRAAEKGDLQTLSAFMRVMTEKHNPVRAATSIVVHMTDGARDLQSFIKGFRSIPPDSRRVLFGTRQGREALAELEKLERVGNRLAPYSDAARNVGGIDLTRRSNILLAVGAMSHMWATMGAAVGAAGLSKFMASPRYLRWLTSTPNAMIGGLSSREAAQHIARLQAITASDSQFGSEILKAAHDVFAPSSAKADDKGWSSTEQSEAKAYH